MDADPIRPFVSENRCIGRNMKQERDPVIRLKNVGLYYHRRQSWLRWERFWAIKDVSFNLYQGETLGVIGSNGTGKSTVLRILAGIMEPDVGQMISNGSQVMLLSVGLGFVPYMSGRKNAIMSGLLLGADLPTINSKIDDIIAFSELEDFIDEPVFSYSTGMRARLGFSVALMMDPDIILIDEVLGVADQRFREKSTLEIQKKIRSNKTVVLVAHNPTIIQHFCDRTVWIENGKSRMEGPTEVVLSNYHEYIKSLQKKVKQNFSSRK